MHTTQIATQFPTHNSIYGFKGTSTQNQCQQALYYTYHFGSHKNDQENTTWHSGNALRFVKALLVENNNHYSQN